MTDLREFADIDNRPFGWGVCSLCHVDALEEDFDPHTRITICGTCRERTKRFESRDVSEDLRELSLKGKCSEYYQR